MQLRMCAECDRGTYRSVSKPGLPRSWRNAAGRELDVRAAVGAEDEVRGACPGDHRIHLPRREIVSHVADLLLDMRRAVGFQNVPDHGAPPLRIYADADAWVCADARLSV